MRVLAVLLNYKTADLTLSALDTLLPEIRAINEGGADVGGARVCVVDNDSGDGSFDALVAGVAARGCADVVDVVASGKNGGYGFGNNVGIRRGLTGHDRADYFYLLNSDAFVEGHALRQLLDYADAHPRCGIAGGYIHGTDGAAHPGVFHYPSIWSELEGGARFGPLSRILKDKVVPCPVPAENVDDVEWVPGASMLMRRAMLEQVGLFDETFFLYFEETDLCHRARDAGWKIAFVREASVAHIVGATTGVRNLKRRTPQYMLDSRRHYFLKHHGRAYLWAANWVKAAAWGSFRVRRTLQGKAEEDYERAWTDFVLHCLKNP